MVAPVFYLVSLRAFTTVSVCTNTTNRFPYGMTASSPRLKPLIKASGAIGNTGASNTPISTVLVATSPP
jgi:hypothetical protein